VAKGKIADAMRRKSCLPFRDRYDDAFATGVIRSLADKLSCISRARWNHNPLMHDARFDDLANLLVDYSIRLKRNETVLIEVFDVPDEMTIALIRAARNFGGIPFVQNYHARVSRALALEASDRQLSLIAGHELARMKKMDAYIAVRGSNNITELSDVPAEKMKLVAKRMRAVQDQRVKKTKWVVLRWPTPSMAQLAGMSTEAFEDFYFTVCGLDYRKLQPGMKALKRLMEKTNRVEIKGPGTDLRFSMKGIPAVICGGDRNIPDGEVFSCPVRDSVQGHVTFNAPSIYQGIGFDGIRLEFKDGKIVDATSNETRKLNRILNSDAGARYVGEFSLGFNPHVLQPMRDILFDEKIAGSFHLTPGQAYEEADNGNRSQVHWDMVSIQRPEYGGGEIYFDGKLIRRDGNFLPKQLRSLNRSRSS
jgi:aminopeptidase